jgi:hypothetical protein
VARRGWGEDSIYWWQARKRFAGEVSRGFDADGRRIRKKVYGRTKTRSATRSNSSNSSSTPSRATTLRPAQSRISLSGNALKAGLPGTAQMATTRGVGHCLHRPQRPDPRHPARGGPRPGGPERRGTNRHAQGQTRPTVQVFDPGPGGVTTVDVFIRRADAVTRSPFTTVCPARPPRPWPAAGLSRWSGCARRRTSAMASELCEFGSPQSTSRRLTLNRSARRG